MKQQRSAVAPQFASAFVFLIPWADLLSGDLKSPPTHVVRQTEKAIVEIPLDGTVEDIVLLALAKTRVVMSSYWLMLCNADGLSLDLNLQPLRGSKWVTIPLEQTVTEFRSSLPPSGTPLPLSVAIIPRPPIFTSPERIANVLDKLQEGPLSLLSEKAAAVEKKTLRAQLAITRANNVAKHELDSKHRQLQAVLKCHAMEDNRLVEMKSVRL